jgi:hypothetical protein
VSSLLAAQSESSFGERLFAPRAGVSPANIRIQVRWNE